MKRSVIRNERGFALLSVVMLLVLALTLGAATLLYTLLDAKSTQQFVTGNQALAAAEAGLLDAINNINSRGVENFATDVVNSTPVLSATPTPVPGSSNVTYQLVSLTSGPTPSTQGVLTVAGNAPLSAQRVIQVKLQRGDFLYGPGALHLSSDSVQSTVNGASLTIDGNNYGLPDLFANPAVPGVLDPSIPPRPGISTRSDTVTQTIISGMTDNQKQNIRGVGFSLSPLVPSVMTTAAASTDDMLRFINDILTANGADNGCANAPNAKPSQTYWYGGVFCVPKTNGNNSGCNNNQPNCIDTFGDTNNPRITEVTDTSASILGGSTGCGILIFDGSVKFGGSFVYCGWVVFRNPGSNGITINGSPVIDGTVWSPLPAWTGGGSMVVDYSAACLTKADGSGTNIYGNMPHPLKITSWTEL